MKPVVINCEKLPFSKALGVPHFITQLSLALSRECELVFALPDLGELETSPMRASLERAASDIVSIDDARASKALTGTRAIELRPHHFQEAGISDLSVLICHDLHVFDVGWKYKQVETVRQSFRDNLRSADAVIAYFPRTYYAVERIAEITLMNLFLTESPLLLDTTRPADQPLEQAEPWLLYPAQLQRHKNHEVLIRALAQTPDGPAGPINVVCPGTDFEASFTQHLRDLARDHDVADQISFVGRISDEDLRELYWRAGGVIVPSLAEGGAYVALEAIAAGVPVAVNDIDSARLHLAALSAEALWFDATSVDDTAGALTSLVAERPVETWNRNITARERIARMTWELVATRWFDVLRWLSGEAGRPLVRVDREGWNVGMTAS